MLRKLTKKSNICLYGPPGSGKTTISKILGLKLKMPVYDVDDDHIERDWGVSVAEKLKELGDDKFLIAEGESTMKINKENTIISLTGSNPLNEKGITHLRNDGLVVFLDVDKTEILDRLVKMKVNRIVGQQGSKSIADILEERKPFYEKNYDVRIIFEENAQLETKADEIIEKLNRDTLYSSTRGQKGLNFFQVVSQGLADDRGLYMPNYIGKFNLGQLKRLVNMTYEERCLRVLETFTVMNPQHLSEFIDSAYSTFHDDKVLPLQRIKGNQYLMEEFHGPTASFKDLALQLFPKLFEYSVQMEKENKQRLVLVATSGDTGSAVLSGFKNSNIPVIVLYPQGGISPIQEAQMTTAEGNVSVIAIKGDFDTCQTAVKDIFNDKNFNSELLQYGYALTSANSINWGRLLPQICYGFNSYLELVKNKEISMGNEIDICVPSGNFGNILGVFIAKKMGVPIRRIICASNENKILTDFLNTGVFDLRNRSLKETMSPAIDILNPSNIERLLYMLNVDVNEVYDKLKRDQYFKLDSNLSEELRSYFIADHCSEEECLKTIHSTYKNDNMLIDPHTAVAKFIADKYNDMNTPMLIASTAHYGKFPEAIFKAFNVPLSLNTRTNLNTLANLNSRVKMNPSLLEVLDKPVIHKRVVTKDEIRGIIREDIKTKFLVKH